MAIPGAQFEVRTARPPRDSDAERLFQLCGFRWTGVGVCRIRALGSSVPVDRFRLERGIWKRSRAGGR